MIAVLLLYFANPSAIASTSEEPSGQESGIHIYVSPSGNDSNDGSIESPFATISKAASVAVPGAVVHVAPGVYNEVINLNRSGTPENRIRYVSDVKWGAKIEVNTTQTPVGVNGAYIDFEGFEVTGMATHGIIIRGSHTRVIGNHVYGFAPLDSQNTNSGGAGIVTYNNAYSMTDIDIVGNVVHDIGNEKSNFIHGIYTAGNDIRVYNNIVYNNAGWGIHAWHAANNNVFSNNLVFGNKTGGIIVGAGDGPGGVTADHFVVTNNIVVYNSGYAIQELGYTGVNNRYENNLVYGNEYEILLKNNLTDLNTLKVDPQFVDFKADGSGDYRLMSTSPAIDAGSLLGAYPTDYEGNARQYGNAVDIGPYEWYPAQVEELLTLIDGYEQSGELQHPLAVQLRNNANQALHHLNNGGTEQAIKSLEDVLKHLHNGAMQPFVSETAAKELDKKTNDLIRQWEAGIV